MRTANRKHTFYRMISKILVLGLLSFFIGSWSAWASPQKDESISCGAFLTLMANHQPGNPLFPENPSQYTEEELYLKTVQNMSAKGYRVLDAKSFHDPLEANEFVQVSYAFANGPLGKNLFEQKLFLKKAGVIDSADVGLTTAYDGKVYQTHWKENVVRPVRLATPVFMNDHFETDLSSKATFTFDDGSTLTLAEGSTVNITKHIYDPAKDLRQTIIHLTRGTVRFVVTKGKAAGSMFKVMTPTAIAGVRGTEFVVDVAPNGKTTFLVLEGQIETKPFVPGKQEARVALISAGESQTVSKNAKAAEVQKASTGLIKAVVAKTSPPGLTMTNKGLSRKMVQNRVKRQGFTQKAGKGDNAKATALKAKMFNNGIKVKALRVANKNALSDIRVLGNRFRNIKLEKSPKTTPGNSVEASTKAIAQANAKAIAQANAKVNAKANAKANVQANAKANARQVAQESSVANGLGRTMRCLKASKC